MLVVSPSAPTSRGASCLLLGPVAQCLHLPEVCSFSHVCCHPQQEHTLLNVPTAGNTEQGLLALAWGPLLAQKALLTTTAGGVGYVWTLTPPEPESDQASAINQWYGQEAFRTSSPPGALFLPCSS